MGDHSKVTETETGVLVEDIEVGMTIYAGQQAMLVQALVPMGWLSVTFNEEGVPMNGTYHISQIRTSPWDPNA